MYRMGEVKFRSLVGMQALTLGRGHHTEDMGPRPSPEGGRFWVLEMAPCRDWNAGMWPH